MGFHARALLRNSHAFGLRGLVDFAASDGVIFRVEPPSAVDDGGWREYEGPAIGNCVLDWYAQRDDVLFQVDAQGFYDGDELLVAS